MPGFTTHYLFGLNTCRKLGNSPLKDIIQKNHAPYSLGLQGPDVFFYFLPSYTIHANNIGAMAHTERTGLFLHYLLNSKKLFSNSIEQQTAMAYIAGFLGHYTLDTHCHPYIYWKTGFQEKNNRYHGRHMGLEVDIDTELLQFYKHCQPSAFWQNSTIRLTSLQRRTIASILHYVYRKTYPELGISYATMQASICAMQLGTKWLHDPSGRKKQILCRLEQGILGYPLLSALIPSDSLVMHSDPLNILRQPWRNPWDKARIFTESFFDLMEQAQKQYLQFLKDLDGIFQNVSSDTARRKQTRALQKKLGNNSYHSGLDCSMFHG